MRTVSMSLAALVAAALLWAAPARAQRIRTGDSGTGVGIGPIEEDPRKQLEALRRRCAAKLESVRQDMANGKYVAAWQTLRATNGLMVWSEQAREWKSLANRVHKVAISDFEQAEKLYAQEDYAAALKAFRQVFVSYGGLPVAKVARQKRQAAEKLPEVRAALLEGQARKMFSIVAEAIAQRRKQLAAKRPAVEPDPEGPTTRPAAEEPPDLEIIKTLDDEKLLRAVGHLRQIVKVCHPAPTALKAAEWVGRLDADPAMKDRLARLRKETRARQDLAKADAYRNAGLHAKAGAMYREILDKHRGSEVALEAARLLGIVDARAKTP